MANNVPLTIQTVQTGNLNGRIVIGKNQLSLDSSNTNVYWYVVVDRTDLSVKANFHTSDNSTVPSQLSPFLNNTQYALILSTQGLRSANLPQGALYDFLMQEGAGRELQRAEQIFETLNCGNWGWFSYAYVAILGDPSTNGFEYLGVYETAMLSTLFFFPVSFGGTTLYTPAAL